MFSVGRECFGYIENKSILKGVMNEIQIKLIIYSSRENHAFQELNIEVMFKKGGREAGSALQHASMSSFQLVGMSKSNAGRFPCFTNFRRDPALSTLFHAGACFHIS